MTVLKDDWEFNVLGVYNYRKRGNKEALFNFIRDNHDAIMGDIVEAGVYRGNTLLALGMFLKEIGSEKIVYGYDSFEGFPLEAYHEYDLPNQFEALFAEGRLSDEHYRAVVKNRKWRESLTKEAMTTDSSSTSRNFDDSNLNLINEKIKILELNNIKIVPGSFSVTFSQSANLPEKTMAVLMDCDLYGSYRTVLEALWSGLSTGGMVFLDEYYSLKFPGARIATDEFRENVSARLEMAPFRPGDFERWFLIKDD